jgi:UDP-N-acetylmuramoyl-tripeptide--D-alanyl-D-alanine ligase
VGGHAAAVGTDVLLTVGPLSEAMQQQFHGEAYSATDAPAAARLAAELVRPGDVVLVKASRGVGLEIVCQALTAGVRA